MLLNVWVITFMGPHGVMLFTCGLKPELLAISPSSGTPSKASLLTKCRINWTQNAGMGIIRDVPKLRSASFGFGLHLLLAMVWGCDMWELSSMVPINGYIISLWDLKIMGNPHGNPGSFFWSVITFHIKSATIWGIPDFWSHFQTCRTGHLVRYRCGPCQCVLLLGYFVICFWRSPRVLFWHWLNSFSR